MGEVWARGRCSGCGVCAGVSRDCLKMVGTRGGEFRPAARECEGCGLCLRVCPAGPPGPGPESSPLGGARGIYVGYSRVGAERARGSSGGMATRLLKSLLEKGLVEGVVAVAPTGRPGRLFAPALLRRPEEVEAAAGSKYYPVEFSGVLRELRSAPGRYALVGLPCVIAALRRAQRELPWVAARLRYLVGLVCGQGVSAHYTTALGYLSGLRGAGPVAVNYRSKENTRLASDFDFIASGGDERQGRALPWTAGPERIWREQLLALPGCFWCADPFAAEADISLMDAWLPAYAADPRGASLLVVRSAELDSLLEEERARGRAALSPLEEAEVLRAQAGALARRRRLLSVGRARGGKRLLLRLLLGRRRGRAYLWRRALGMRGVGKRLGLGAFSLYLAFLRGSEAMGRRLSGARLGKRLSFISSEGRFDREKRNDLSAGRTCRLP